MREELVRRFMMTMVVFTFVAAVGCLCFFVGRRHPPLPEQGTEWWNGYGLQNGVTVSYPDNTAVRYQYGSQLFSLESDDSFPVLIENNSFTVRKVRLSFKKKDKDKEEEVQWEIPVGSEIKLIFPGKTHRWTFKVDSNDKFEYPEPHVG